MAYTEPGDVERRYYHHGLPGGPLIVRSNCHAQPWDTLVTTTSDLDWDGEPVLRVKRFVGVERISTIDDIGNIKNLRKVYPLIFKLLEEFGINWLWFAGIRIGYSDSKKPADFPLVLYLNVEPGTQFRRIEPIVRRIRSGLVGVGLKNVHVEVRENVMEWHGASGALEKAVEGLRISTGDWYKPGVPGMRVAEWYLKFHRYCGSTLGWNISQDVKPDDELYQGTAGPFITLKDPKMQGKIFVLTANHTFRPEDQDTKPIEPFNHLGKPRTANSLRICQGNRQRLTKNLKTATEMAGMCIAKRKELEKAISETKDFKKLSELEDKLDIAKNDEKFFTGVCKELEALLKRDDLSVGTICVMPPFKVYGPSNAGPQSDLTGFVADWVLVELDQDKFKEARNMVYLTDFTHFTEECLGDEEHPNVGNLDDWDEDTCDQVRAQLKDQYNWLLMTGEYLRNERTGDGIPQCRVVKRGINGLTFGVTSGAEAVLRTWNGDKKEYVGAWEIPVLPFPTHYHFSLPGDSGAAVIDTDGCYIGEVVAGDLTVTFVAPAWVILEGVQRGTGIEPRIIVPKPFTPTPS